MSTLRQTASQTAGPYVHIGLAPGQAGFERSVSPTLGSVDASPEPKYVLDGEYRDREHLEPVELSAVSGTDGLDGLERDGDDVEDD